MDERELNSIAENPAELAALKKLLALLSNHPELLQGEVAEENPPQPRDPYLDLLEALRPFLTPQQAERLPKARELVRFLRQKGEEG